MRGPPTDIPKLTFRLGKPTDVAPLLQRFGDDFFTESGFGEFAEFDIDRAEMVMGKEVEAGATPFVVAEVDGEPAGLISYALAWCFTKRPIACLWLIYVAPAYRRSPLGRMLILHAMNLAKGDGACAFFATIFPPTRTGRSLCNLFRRVGFKPMSGAVYRSL